MIAGTNAQQAVWQDSGINTLKMRSIIESCYPAASACMPLPRQAAGTLSASFVENFPVKSKKGNVKIEC